jgi:hypothetical protein
MGMGDEIMVSGEVKRLAGKSRVVFRITDPRRYGKSSFHRWHPAWENNPRIAKPGWRFDRELTNCGGYRPYIEAKHSMQWRWCEYGPTPGELFFNEYESAFSHLGKGRVIVQSNIKAAASPNKMWPAANWAELIAENPDMPWLQVGEPSDEKIRGAAFLATPTFRAAAAVLSGARAAVLLEGGLHHAAAAVGLPAVVIFGGYIGPKVTGYATHRNLFPENNSFPLGCGYRMYCPHCYKAMREITPTDVMQSLNELL